MELRRPAHVAQSALALLDGLQAEAVTVEPPRSLQVLAGQLGDGMRGVQRPGHSVPPHSGPPMSNGRDRSQADGSPDRTSWITPAVHPPSLLAKSPTESPDPALASAPP